MYNVKDMALLAYQSTTTMPNVATAAEPSAMLKKRKATQHLPCIPSLAA
jgi:hypothetical protein